MIHRRSPDTTTAEPDFDALREGATLFAGQRGLDAEIRLHADGRVRVKQFTPPSHAIVERETIDEVVVGYREETVTETRKLRVGTRSEERTRRVAVGHRIETYTVAVPVYAEREVERTRQVPVYGARKVRRSRWARVFKPYPGSADGSGAGEYVWTLEEFETDEDTVIGCTDETYVAREPVQIGEHTEERTREVPVYETETLSVEVPIYEEREVRTIKEVPIVERRTRVETAREFVAPKHVDTTFVDLDRSPGTIFIDGRITRLEGDLRGRLTVVGNEKVRISGSLRYVDSRGRSAMQNGADHTQPYERNPSYRGDSVLGVIARGDILLTAGLPQQAEVNATLLSVEGRVGIDGFCITAAGEPDKDYLAHLPEEERFVEEAYNRTNYRSMRFTRESLRRMGGIVSKDKVVESLIRPRGDGSSYVDSGFKRGATRFDVNLLSGPPPNFVQVPPPDTAGCAPIPALVA